MKGSLVGFAGMTHLGLVSAAAVAGRGFDVVCFDPDAALIERLRRRDWPVLEPGLDDLVRANGLRQRFTAAAAQLLDCDVVYAAPDVTTDDAGASDLVSLTKLARNVAAALKPDAVLVVLSQVPPGYTRGLASLIGLSAHRLYCQVETLVFGQAVERALKPERIIIGCADPGKPLDPRFAAVLEAFGCPLLRMRYESAELAKISINCCLAAATTAANTLAELCEAAGADWSEIVPALKLDRRIGPHAYLSAGLGIAGGNLERDLATIQELSARRGTESGLIVAMTRNSRYRRDWPLRQLNGHVLWREPDPLIAILGLAYKENTRSTRNSPALALIRDLSAYRVAVFDPEVTPQPEWHPHLRVASSALETCDGADALVIMTPWPQFRSLAPAAIAGRLRGRVVIDPFSMLDGAAAAAAGLERLVLGAPLPGEGNGR